MVIRPIRPLATEGTNELFERIINKMLDGSSQPLDSQCFRRLSALLRRFLEGLIYGVWYVKCKSMTHLSFLRFHLTPKTCRVGLDPPYSTRVFIVLDPW